MTRLNRIIKSFTDYSNFIEDIMLRTNDKRKEAEYLKLKQDVDVLICELRRYGCRREH